MSIVFMMPSIEILVAGLFGLVAGSFLNVCIWRLPRKESIAWPGSKCPQCNHGLSWRDNIPLFSFLICRGRCCYCQKKISKRYPAVEILSACIWIISWNTYPHSFMFIISGVYLSLLLVAIFTDFETGLIPDFLTLPGIGIGMALSFFYPPLQEALTHLKALQHCIVGFCAGALLGYFTGIAGKGILKKESLGGGDIKLLAMTGAFLGWQGVLLTFFMAPFFALPFALYYRWIKKQEIMPYGPFLSIAAGLVFFYRERIIEYLQLHF